VGQRRRLIAVGVLALGVAIAIGVGALGGEQQTPSKPAGVRATAAPTASPCEARTSRVLRLACGLSPAAKVAQLFLLGDAPSGALRRLDVGGMVVVQSGDLAVARSVARPKRRVAPWVLAVQEGGERNAFAGVPPTAAPADVPSAKAAVAQASASARALRGLGISGVLGPVVDVGVEAGAALGTRVYSDDTDDVSAYAERVVRAYRKQRSFSAVEHFPGLGAADVPTESGPASVGLSLRELRQRDLRPFAAASAAGAPAVVVGHGLYALSGYTTPASLSRRVVTTLLRDELGFQGVAIADDLAEPAVSLTTPVPLAAVQAIQAGADLVYISGPARAQEAAFAAVLRAVRRGKIDRKRLDEAVVRDVSAKRDYGLLR
jgi:beta-N-acetylhexosaminidase